MPAYHLAQINIGRILAPLDSEQLSGFVAQLDEINALADAAPGFVWRLQTEDGDATALRPYDDDRILLNMSVWESLETLHDYVYRSHHADVLRQRRQWFERLDRPIVALWWVAAGHRPSVAEAIERLEHLQVNGETAWAFTARRPFPPPDAEEAPRPLLDACPA